jgi:uncharacterized RDD family membrane protein YckC
MTTMESPAAVWRRNPYAPTSVSLAGSHPVQQLQPATRPSRALASLIDAAIGGAVLLPASLGYGLDAAQGLNASGPGPYTTLGTLLTILAGLLWVAITLHLMSRNGQSIGKKAFGIKVVRRDGSPASLGRILWLRNVVNALPVLIPILGELYFLVDALMIFGQTRQCLHDQIADTLVVKA